MKPCPQCGCYRVLPHCSDPACTEQWCNRAQCGWTSGASCAAHDLPEPLAYPEELPYARRFFKPMIEMGSISPSRWSGKMQFDDNWKWDESSPLPTREPDEVLAFVSRVMGAIRALAGPATW